MVRYLLLALARFACSLQVDSGRTVVKSRKDTFSLPGVVLATWASPALARPEWACALDQQDFKIEKRLESSVRIKPETMLVASDAKKQREVKLVKVPLGRTAVTSFTPDEQIELSRYFASRQAAEAIGSSRIADILLRSLQRQAASPRSPLESVDLDPSSVSGKTRNGRRYVSVDYVTDGCRRRDEDGDTLVGFMQSTRRLHSVHRRLCRPQ